MKYNQPTAIRSTHHTDVQQEPKRVPPRLEGVVKNTGTRPVKKKRTKI